MKTTSLCLVAASCLLTQCAEVESEASASPSQEATSNPYGQPLTAKSSRGRISIMEGSKAISFIIPAMPNVEETKFINEQNQIVVKSRGSHGPATVQLFDSRSGRLEGKVMAYEVTDDQPAWAAGMGE